jgi:hypothetical protein
MNTDRIANQAREFNVFHRIIQANETFIKDYIQKHKNHINTNRYGYGFMIWKPKIIYETLHRMNENDILVWCDAGMYLNLNGKDRLNEYFLKLTNDNDKSVLAFSTSDCYLSKQYVKMDAVMHYYPEFRNKMDVACYSGVMMIKKNVSSMTLINDWLDLCENYHFLDQSASLKYKEAKYFCGNDYDNGLFCLCLSKHENIVAKIGHEETNVFKNGIQLIHCPNINPKSIDWSSLDKFPLQCRRMTPKTGY